MIFNSQDNKYEGWSYDNEGIYLSQKILAWDRENSIGFDMPPLGVVYFKKIKDL